MPGQTDIPTAASKEHREYNDDARELIHYGYVLNSCKVCHSYYIVSRQFSNARGNCGRLDCMKGK